MSLTVNEFFAPENGLIRQVKKNFSPRKGQAELSRLISGAIDSGIHVIAEAATGFGKSFAVLVPAIVQAIENNKRIVISTETLALQDQYCLAPETRVLTKDLRYIAASEVTLGMELVGFDEEVPTGEKRRKFKTASVETLTRFIRPCYRLTFDDGTSIVASSEHRWLCGRGACRPHWMTTERLCVQKGLRPGSRVIKPFDTWEQDLSWGGGYLAASIAGEGHLSQHKSEAFNGFTNALFFSQKKNGMFHKVKELLIERNYAFTEPNRTKDVQQIRISPRHEMLRFLGSIRPERVLDHFSPDMLGSMFANRSAHLIAREYVGEQEVVAIGTSTRTFIAEGFASHNCYSDLPLLQKACQKAGYNFYYAAAKGKNNYVCRLKVNEDEQPTDSQLMRWAQNLTIDDAGDISDVTFEFEPQEWWKIACDDDCTKKACPFYGAGSNVERGDTDCFVYQARRNYNEAQIVVANHTLVLLDASLGAGTLLGPYDVLIVDEAHSMPERAQDAWGTSLRPHSISKTVVKISTMLGRINLKLPNDNLTFYKDMESRFFEHFAPVVHKGQSTPMDKVSHHIVEAAHKDADLIVAELKKLGRDLNNLLDGNADESPVGQAVATAKESLQMLTGSINKVFGDPDPEFAANWLAFVEVSNTARGGKQAVLHVKPIEVAPLMRGMIIDKVPTCVFLSATMKIKGSFTFMRKELGLPYDKTQEFCGDSPFDYASSVVAHCPRTLPACDRDNEEQYLDKIAQECIAIIKKMEGRTMVLFTNASHMRQVHNRVVANVRYQLYLQGTMSKNAILEEFRRNVGSCLFATRSFFTGVDVPGEALSCVVLVKCPFRVTTDPMFAARCAKIKESGGSDFIDYALPLMLFDLRQAFGRLIRTVSDKGLFCFLDSRATTKSYWQDIRNSLPMGMKYIQDINRYDGL